MLQLFVCHESNILRTVFHSLRWRFSETEISFYQFVFIRCCVIIELHSGTTVFIYLCRHILCVGTLISYMPSAHAADIMVPVDDTYVLRPKRSPSSIVTGSWAPLVSGNRRHRTAPTRGNVPKTIGGKYTWNTPCKKPPPRY